jgi:glucoamylase
MVSPYSIWRFNHKCRTMPEGAVLRVEVQAAAVVRWSSDAWAHDIDVPTTDSTLGIHHAELATAGIPAPSTVTFTIRWIDESRWEGTDFSVTVVPPDQRRDMSANTNSERDD